MFELVGLSVLFVLAAIGIWHLVNLYLKKDEARLRSFEKWAEELYGAAHELIDADMNVARCEARLMKIIATVPPETAYQTIRRIGLGRQMENAILMKLEEMGLGEGLPPATETPAPVTSLAPVSRRHPR